MSLHLNPGIVKQLALEAGFKLRTQADGSEDLNSYVYHFARTVMDLHYAAVNHEMCFRCVHYKKAEDEEPCVSCRVTATNFEYNQK